MPRNFRKNGRKTDRFIESNSDRDGSHSDRNYFSHDNRDGIRKQNFRGRGGRIEQHHNRPKLLDSGRLQRIIEQDVEMGGSSNQTNVDSRQSYRGRNKNRNINSRSNQNNQSFKDGSWSKVLLPNGKQYEKEFILKTLLNASKAPFIPIYYHIEGNNSVFYVEDAAAAKSLIALNKQITLADGFKLAIVVKWSPAPNLPINDELKEKIKLVMSRRYDAVTKVLNLSQFHLDEQLCIDYYTPLSRENIMQTVVEIINNHIPDVQVIDASHNKIFNVNQMKPLATKASSLKTLNLGNNKLTQITALDPLQGLPLEQLILNQNPLCDRFSEQSTYISAVRKRFPKLLKLDGVDLPPVISFDIEAEDVRLPPSQSSSFVSDEARLLVLSFLEQYLSIYDSDDRQPLLNAYNDSAVLSMTCSYPSQTSNTSAARLDVYMKDSRNLKRLDDVNRRSRLLQQGKIDIISFLTKLPKTLHDPRSLVVDVPVASSNLIVVSVTGVFRERAERNAMLRAFQRVFVIVPSAAGLCIVNEQLHVTLATSEQIRSAFKDPIVPVAVPATTSVAPVAALPAESAPQLPVIDSVVKEQMILSFAEQSGMNVNWSLKCLEENGWNFEHAAFVFSELKKNNQIPPEAFIK